MGLSFAQLRHWSRQKMSISPEQTPPGDFEQLTAEISRNYEALPKRLRDIARFALDNPSLMALETIANISRTAHAQPSAVVRFAKAMGYSGFSEMQRIYQRHVAEQSASYKERIRSEMVQDEQAVTGTPRSLLQQYCEANIVSLRNLEAGIEQTRLEAAVNLIRQADHVYIMAQRRSFPVANYLAYMLSHVECRTHLLDGQGGMLREQAQAMTVDDLLIAISFYPYAEDTVEVVARASERGIPRIGISDSDLSPICAGADTYFSIHDAEVHQFRSLSATMVLAQVLATSMAFDNDRNGG
jgi:DNA-binding MurR/RpiR family transcriptional regulator